MIAARVRAAEDGGVRTGRHPGPQLGGAHDGERVAPGLEEEQLQDYDLARRAATFA